MPEGHTLHRLAHEVGSAFGGRRVRVSSPQGRFAESARLVDGTELVTAESWGKHLWVHFAHDDLVHVQHEHDGHVHHEHDDASHRRAAPRSGHDDQARHARQVRSEAGDG